MHALRAGSYLITATKAELASKSSIGSIFASASERQALDRRVAPCFCRAVAGTPPPKASPYLLGNNAHGATGTVVQRLPINESAY